MAFFNTGIDETGRAGLLSVSPQWWYFPIITVPLTILVFGVWQWWRRRREADVSKSGYGEKLK